MGAWAWNNFCPTLRQLASTFWYPSRGGSHRQLGFDVHEGDRVVSLGNLAPLVKHGSYEETHSDTDGAEDLEIRRNKQPGNDW